jgi:hypothetical protein
MIEPDDNSHLPLSVVPTASHDVQPWETIAGFHERRSMMTGWSWLERRFRAPSIR